MTWRELDQEHNKGIFHDDGICAWCDHVRQLEKDGYYDYLKVQNTNEADSSS